MLSKPAATWKVALGAELHRKIAPPGAAVHGGAPRLTLLTTKMVLVPLLIAAITVAGQRLGPRVAGALTGLPVVAGPVARPWWSRSPASRTCSARG